MGYDSVIEMRKGFKNKNINQPEKSINNLMPVYLSKVHD